LADLDLNTLADLNTTAHVNTTVKLILHFYHLCVGGARGLRPGVMSYSVDRND